MTVPESAYPQKPDRSQEANKTGKHILSLLLALVMIFGLTACAGTSSGHDTANKEAVYSETRIFTDDCGREVALPEEITAFVSSGPLSQAVLFAIAPEMLVGLAAEWGDTAEGIIPDGYFNLPYFGQLYGSANLNVEELATVGPQLIIDIGEAKSSLTEDMDALEAQTQIPSIHIEATLGTMPDAFRKLGDVLGRQEKGEELAQFCEQVYERTVSVMEKVGENKVRALYVFGEDGLNILANGSYHAELIDMLVDNIAVVDTPTAGGSGNEVTMEQIALWDPDFIMFGRGSICDTVSEKEAWKELSAISGKYYVEVPEGPLSWIGSPPSVQRYLGLIWLPALLYPEYCDYDVKADIMEYYRLFYGCVLTDEQYDALTADAFPKR